jgi:GT2 family glycosyltransferase
MEARIRAVVVTRDRPIELRKAIEGLLAQTAPLDGIIVVDNAGDIPASATLAGLPAEIIRSPGNLGGAGGFRTGMERALEYGADWIWLMDDDAIPDAGALSRLFDSLADLPPNTGALCGAVTEYGRLARRHRRYFNEAFGIECSVPKRLYDEPWVEICTASFVGFLVSAVAVKSIGLPEAEFFLSYDDTEYSLRLKQAGWRTFLIPGSHIVHLRPANSRMRVNPFGQKHYYNVRNRIAVRRRFCKFPMIAALDGAIFGILIWLLSRKPFSRCSFGTFRRALMDGWQERLGPFPGDEG